MLSRPVLVMIMLGFLTLAACSPSSSQALTANLWMLTELDGQAPLPDTAITAEFSDDGKVGGSASCNSYSTTYTVKGDQISFSEQIAATLMACDEPIMTQEQKYLEVLSETATYEVSDDVLTLFDTNGNSLVKFKALSQALEGSSWQVIGYNNGKGGVVSLILDTEITATFDEEGQLTGNAGCNNYFASYEIDGDKISIGPAGATAMFCTEPEGIMEQEQQYLAALQTAATYKITGLNMEMRTTEGSLVANFQRAVLP
jgi:heat shock protein HslJ